MRRALLLSIALGAGLVAPAVADEPTVLQVELDPLPFATGRYGVQIGARHPALRGVRISVASFSVNVPDAVTQMGDGNEGFHLQVRPSFATYVLYYFAPPGEDGITVGGALRYLRLRYTHDDEMHDEALVSEVSPEAIVGYQWHPFESGVARSFYVQPWLGLSFTLARSGEALLGGREYDSLPVLPFVTVNLGWELWR